MTTRLSNAERSHRTRRALLDVGRALFADVGYARTTTEELVRRAGVTRGALYYHFPDKTALFEAVFEEVHQECLQAMSTGMETAEGDPWERFMASLRVLIAQLGRPTSSVLSLMVRRSGVGPAHDRGRWVRRACVPFVSSWSPRG